MKRDMDLCRLLLMDVEGDEKPDLSKYSDEHKTYHTALLIEAKLIDGAVARDGVGYPAAAHAIKLTWQGHEFLDAARNETIWKKTIAKIKTAGSTVTFPILQEILTAFIKQQIGV